MALNISHNPSEVSGVIMDVFQINYRKLSHYQIMASWIKESCHIICEKLVKKYPVHLKGKTKILKQK